MLKDCNLKKKPKTVDTKKNWKLNAFELKPTVIHTNNMLPGQNNNMYKKE